VLIKPNEPHKIYTKLFFFYETLQERAPSQSAGWLHKKAKISVNQKDVLYSFCFGLLFSLHQRGFHNTSHLDADRITTQNQLLSIQKSVTFSRCLSLKSIPNYSGFFFLPRKKIFKKNK
jgi:hypothetical protein